MGNNYLIDCVLLIDDDIVTNFINENLLSSISLCHEIVATESVEEALEFIEGCYASKESPKSLLIFLDINMPAWDGFDFLDELNSRSNIPIHKIDVVILSSSIHRIDTERAKRYSILDYIVKPLTLGKLQATLSRKRK